MPEGVNTHSAGQGAGTDGNGGGASTLIGVSCLWTLKDLAAFLKMSERTAYRLASGGKIPCVRPTGAHGGYRFLPDEVQRWVKRQR